MVKYLVFSLISIFLSLAVEKILHIIFSGEKFSLRSKINIKRFVSILIINVAIWLLCLYFHWAAPITAFLLCIGFDILLCIAIEDIKRKNFSNVYLILLLVLAIAVTLMDNSTPWYIHIFGCGMGYLPMFFIRALGEKIKKQEVLGAGDVYLSGILGLMLGLYKYLLCGIIASLIALITVRIIRHKKNYDKMHAYPFSPFFLLGYTVTILFGDLIVNGYIELIIGRI